MHENKLLYIKGCLQIPSILLNLIICMGICLYPNQSYAKTINIAIIRMNMDDALAVIQGINTRKIPSFALLGRPAVEKGVLAGRLPEMEERVCRRLALNIHQIIMGESPDNLNVTMSIPASLVLKMASISIILLTVPPMFTGITTGLLLTGDAFGFMALLGMVSLLGIIVNNAIMMIDQIEIEKGQGKSVQDAIILSAQKRLRPIIMTTITTIMGLIPLSLQGGTLWSPMANVLIFGLAFATALTLALCPVLYSYFYGAGFRGYVWNHDLMIK